MEKDGLTIVYTGKGKGKTTAALGIALRATGYEKRTCMIQFIKGSWHYGEMDSSKKLEPEFEMVAVGKGFVGIINYLFENDQNKEFCFFSGIKSYSRDSHFCDSAKRSRSSLLDSSIIRSYKRRIASLLSGPGFLLCTFAITCSSRLGTYTGKFKCRFA